MRAMRNPVEWFIGLRYLRARRRTRFVSFITFISMAGIALGVAAVIVILSGLTGFDTTQWLGILAPKGTSAEVITRVHAESAKALALADVKERLAQAALQPVGSTPREFEALIRADLERWTAIAKELKLEPQ